MDSEGDQSWFAEDAGPLVRPFALTRGRTRADRHALTMITLLLTVRLPAFPEKLTSESAAIVRMCRGRPRSVAEIAAELNLLVAVAKVLISDLIDESVLARQTTPLPDVRTPDLQLLQAVLDGVRRL